MSTNRTKDLTPYVMEGRAKQYSAPQEVRQLIDQVLSDIDSFDGAPNTWHSMAMIAGRMEHWKARILIIRAGLRQWPMDVDLLCELLPMLAVPGEGFNPEDAKATWETLSGMDLDVTGTHWRFWTYGASYLARQGKRQEALDLLDEGLQYVNRDALMDIFRSYRRVLIDHGPLEALGNGADVREYQLWVSKTLEERLKLGLQFGLENGYVLAIELARLYQEDAASGQDGDKLQKAIAHLDLAEQMYTGNPNHPIWDIYLPKARILVALRRYGDALRILRSLPGRIRSDPSVETLLRLAALTTGEPIETDLGDDRSPEDRALEALPTLLGANGALLAEVASQNPAIADIVVSVARRLVESHAGTEQ